MTGGMMTREQWERLADGSNYYDYAKAVIKELALGPASAIAIQQLAVAMYASRHHSRRGDGR